MITLPPPLAACASVMLMLSFPVLSRGQHGSAHSSRRLIDTKDTAVCIGRQVPIRTAPMKSFRWDPPDGLDDPTSPSPKASPRSSTKYYLSVFTPSPTNLLGNGDFSQGNTGFSTGYIFYGTRTGAGEYYVGPDPQQWNNVSFWSCGDHTSGSGNMMMINGSLAKGVKVWGQRIPVVPGRDYLLSGWTQPLTDGNPAVLQISINGKPIGTPDTANPKHCTWQQFKRYWSSGTDTVADIAFTDLNTGNGSNDFALDDLGFHIIDITRDSISIVIHPTPAIAITPDTTVCRESPVRLHLSVSTAGVCQWSPAAMTDDPASFTPLVNPGTAATFRVSIIDSNGCSYQDSTRVTTRAAPTIITARIHDIDCAQPTTQIQASGAASYSWQPATGLDDPSSATPTVSIDTTTTYTVTGTAADGCQATAQITVKVHAEGANRFVVPNAFTPNGDGHNDKYTIQRWGNVKLEEMSIYDKRGMRIFYTRRPDQGWDGTFNGNPQPAGGYVYFIRANTFCGPLIRRGTVMLIR